MFVVEYRNVSASVVLETRVTNAAVIKRVFIMMLPVSGLFQPIHVA